LEKETRFISSQGKIKKVNCVPNTEIKSEWNTSFSVDIINWKLNPKIEQGVGLVNQVAENIKFLKKTVVRQERTVSAETNAVVLFIWDYQTAVIISVLLSVIKDIKHTIRIIQFLSDF